MEIKTEIIIETGTVDFIFGLRKNRFVELEGKKTYIGDSMRMAVSPLDWEKAAAFCQCPSTCPAEHKVGLYCLPVEPLHPILKVLKECWTDEVVNAFQYAQDLGNHMAANNGEIPEWSKNNDSNNDSNNSSMKEEFLTNELNSINAMMQSFTQNDYSEQEFIQLQQAQKEVLKQLNQLKD